MTKSTLILQKATPLNFTMQICLRRPFQGELIWWNSTLAEVYFLMTKKRKVKKKPKKAVNPVYFLMTKKRKVKKLKKTINPICMSRIFFSTYSFFQAIGKRKL